MDHYLVLGLSRDASQEEIREAYFNAAKTHHPDVNPDSGARERFLKIQEAYDTLSEPEKRNGYNKVLPEIGHPAQIQIGYELSRRSLLASRDPQLLYMLLEISTTAKLDKNTLPPAHIVFVIDRSTSMQGDRVSMVKNSISQIIRKLKSHDWISVVVFSDRAEVLVPPMRAAELGKFEERIGLIRTSGSTELAHGLRLGLEQFAMIRGLQTTRQLVLLTDGHTYGDEAACLALAEQALGEKIKIDGVGIGHEWNDEFLDLLCSKTGGTAQYVKDARDIQEFLDQKINAVNGIYAKNLRLDLSLPDDVELRYGFRIQPDSSHLGSSPDLILGDLLYAQSIQVILEFKVIANQVSDANFQLFKGRLWADMQGRVEHKIRKFIDIELGCKAYEEPEPLSAKLLKAMSQISMYQLQDKARREVAEGKVEAAATHLQYLATNLLSQGSRILAHDVLVEAENIRMNRGFSKEGEKRIKYGTRALMLPSGLELN